jgi:hypothetical protein
MGTVGDRDFSVQSAPGSTAGDEDKFVPRRPILAAAKSNYRRNTDATLDATTWE